MALVSEKFVKLGLKPADIMIPKKNTNLKKWAVVACDQYTSEKEYWKDVEDYVGDSPSTLHLIFPECYLEDGDSEQRIEKINRTMASYIKQGLFDTYENCFFLIKRTCGNTSRLGLMAALDLDRYSWEKDSKSLIRATEGTILSRIPPRKAIRKDAGLEIPHIMVLISDNKKKIIESLYEKRDTLTKIYDTELMKNGGKLEAYLVNDEKDLQTVLEGFEALTADLNPDNPLLFAMGDGNHSFATAKSCWEDIKKGLSEEERKNHPARFCLVELENIFDPGLVFEPIHRVLFNVPEDVFIKELEKNADGIEYETVKCKNCIDSRNKDQKVQGFGYCTADKHVYVRIKNPKSNIAAGTIQRILDSLISKGYTVDYIHGIDVTDKLGSEKGNIGIFLPAIDKETFFDTIIKDGALPRKTFSMGEANEKRYYMECRRIK
ncbi:MAG: DUF1015 domain-containing protein [Sphaerochaetaceae bacterium]|nr:DUF1015 domain-containing protein [Sphaerochaetaceae bacterium]